MAEELMAGQDSKEKEEIITKLTSSIEEVASSTQTVYEAVEQVAKSASALAKAGQESVEQARFLQEKNADQVSGPVPPWPAATISLILHGKDLLRLFFRFRLFLKTLAHLT